jgi:hypothetical protein
VHDIHLLISHGRRMALPHSPGLSRSFSGNVFLSLKTFLGSDAGFTSTCLQSEHAAEWPLTHDFWPRSRSRDQRESPQSKRGTRGSSTLYAFCVFRLGSFLGYSYSKMCCLLFADKIVRGLRLKGDLCSTCICRNCLPRMTDEFY